MNPLPHNTAALAIALHGLCIGHGINSAGRKYLSSVENLHWTAERSQFTVTDESGNRYVVKIEKHTESES